MLISSWHGLYRESWGQNRLRPASFAHPAKNSYGLSVRIYEHALEEGWIEPGQTVLDPFAGIGGFALEAMRHGLHFVGCELEQRFVDMGQGCDCTGISKADWVRFQGRWDRMRYEGGRHWCPECLARAGAVTGEREFKPLPLPGTKWAALAKTHQPALFDAAPSASYVRNSGKIPCMGPHHYRGNIETWERQGMAGSAVIVQGDSRRLGEVLGRARLCLSSPPFGSTLGKGGETKGFHSYDKDEAYNRCKRDYVIPADPANLGNLPEGDHAQALEAGAETGRAELCLSSPPWEASVNTMNEDNARQYDAWAKNDDGSNRLARSLTGGGYGSASGQLGQETGTTFWAASREILEQVYQVLAPGAHAIFVCKRFVRNKAIVDFPLQWAHLCKAVGFKWIHHHKAWLVEDRGAQHTLEGGLEKREVRRMSFFRRLHTQKYPHLAILWEDVLCFVKD